MEYITFFLKTNTNYCNKNNLFNFFIAILQHRNEEEVKIFVDLMKVHMGLTFLDEFKKYLFRKIPKSKILVYMD